jgi:Replication-relaxation
MTTAAARKPRFERRPRELPAFEMTPRDEAIVRLIARHRFARSTDIIKLIGAMYPGSSPKKILERLHFLFHSNYISRPRVQLEPYRAGAGSQPLVYILGNRGADLLASKFAMRRSAVDWTAKSRTASRGEVEHALETTDFVVALELACRRSGHLDVIYFDEILKTIAPPKTRESPRPYFWPVTADWQGREATVYVIPDKIIGIRNRHREVGHDQKFFFIEIDRGTQPVVRSNLAQSSILRKLIGYGTTYRDDLHKTVYNLPNFRVLTITTGRKRIENIIDAHDQHTKTLCSPKLFLFAPRPDLLAAPDFFAYPWVDAAGSPVRLLD